MNRIPMEAWIANLRSKRFKQGTGANCRLGIDGEKYYCCLGVANETAMEHGISIQKQLIPNWGRSYGLYEYNNIVSGLGSATTGSLHYLTHKWLGVECADCGLGGNTLLTVSPDIDAIQANDGLGWSFDQIADALEQRLNELCPPVIS